MVAGKFDERTALTMLIYIDNKTNGIDASKERFPAAIPAELLDKVEDLSDIEIPCELLSIFSFDSVTQLARDKVAQFFETAGESSK